jgi:DNA replicative helicase MCM subunit Mcm2 (Cdc46/Mcm family)
LQPNEEPEVRIPEKDLRNFLYLVSRQKVTTTPEAQDLLGKYFIKTRRNLPGRLVLEFTFIQLKLLYFITDAFNQRTMHALHRISEAHARLSLRREVLKTDVIAAIIICERFMKHIFEDTNNEAPQASSFQSLDDVEMFFQRFKEWLYNFVQS